MKHQPRTLLPRMAGGAALALLATPAAVLAGPGVTLPPAAGSPLPGLSSLVPPMTTPAATFAGGPGSSQQMGAAVALSANGQVAMVGAPAANGGDGAVYIYAGSTGTWSSTPVATLAGPAGAKDEFGSSVTLSANGQVALVGAPGGSSAPSNDGAAYVFVESGGTWPSTPAATFAGPPGSGAKLGFSVALSASGDIALVGAPVAADGSAYLYAESGGTWSSTPTTTLPGSDAGGEFGSSVALSANGQVALIGAPGAGSSYDGAGYVYAESQGKWAPAPVATFTGPPGAGAELGAGVALSADGRDALLGAPGAGPSFDGVAYLYDESAGNWPSTAAATFTGPLDSSAWLGTSVALSSNGQVALMGGPVTGNGAAYLYAESAGAWPATASTTFTPPSGSPAELGSEVALSANGQVAMMGGSPYTGGVAIDGDAYLYAAPAGSYQALQTITVTSPPAAVRAGTIYTPAATASSGLPVAFSIDSSSTRGACSLTGSTVRFTGTGACLVDANQAGSSAWAAAAPVQIDINVKGSSPQVLVVSSSATVAGARVPVNLSCRNGPCAGTAELVKRTVVLARAPYSMAAGTSTVVRLRLTPAGSALFGHVKGHSLTEELVVSVRSGKGATKKISVS